MGGMPPPIMKKNETACQAKCQPVMLPVMPKSRHMQTPFGVIFMPNHANHAKQPKAWALGTVRPVIVMLLSDPHTSISAANRGGRSGVRVYKAGRSPDETKRDEMKRSENERTKRKE